MDPAVAGATGAALGGAGSFNDADSFEKHYRDPSARMAAEEGFFGYHSWIPERGFRQPRKKLIGFCGLCG
jgi:hypothetical protein